MLAVEVDAEHRRKRGIIFTDGAGNDRHRDGDKDDAAKPCCQRKPVEELNQREEGHFLVCCLWFVVCCSVIAVRRQPAPSTIQPMQDWGMSLSGDPGAGAVGPDFLFPDGCLGFERVDEPSAGVKGVLPMGS